MNWWREVKRISGHSPVNNYSYQISLLANAIDNFDHMSPKDRCCKLNQLFIFGPTTISYSTWWRFARFKIRKIQAQTSEMFYLNTSSLQVNEFDSYKSLNSLNPYPRVLIAFLLGFKHMLKSLHTQLVQFWIVPKTTKNFPQYGKVLIYPQFLRKHK